MAKKYLKDKKGIVRATSTTNLQLEKPLLSDNYDIEVHNRNMDKIDSAIQGVKGQVAGIELTAERVSVKDSEDLLASSTVELALAEIVKKANTNASNIGSLQIELGTNKSTLEANINAIRGVL